MVVGPLPSTAVYIPGRRGRHTNGNGVYYHISNAIQYSNTALETTALVMHDSDTFFYVVPLFLMAQRIS